MQLFETMKIDHGDIPRLEYHTQRIQQSSQQLGFTFNLEDWNNLISLLKVNYVQGIYRLKISLNRQGEFDYIAAPVAYKEMFTAQFEKASQHVPREIVTNKTTNRKHLAHMHMTDLILLYDNKGKILEFDIGNIVIEENGMWYTPIYEEDFLKGCMRQQLIDNEQVQEKNYFKNDLIKKIKSDTVRIYLINSLREVAEVSINI
ncbi:aminotransferase class IV [Staphylococcus simiae]|uniref:aminotransferase class IV n=1 Tax=Staphylococcus simiae TaxID=308354 RepID=UPI001A95F26A|nr:aminotransferase class IV [Staphylococcus simiae]MBO1198801.1 aminotransferase class IV [Staphylococcus simiae]MBO1200748.1 aminotransferase class IV [Staphylococcus simiae]MBO1203261.1 aminotransferase class IV [Staphylococcus simiae]MBO1210568.1 aminotransferase class IV [Staphylococcus simiae]MBO1229084.1 aminotransferase class IV [Staphylococcus simiae]